MAIGPMLSACGSSAEEGGTDDGADAITGTITLLNAGNLDSTPYRKKVYDDFKAQHAGLEFDIRALPTDAGWDQQARTTIQSGDAVDLLAINGQFIRAWVRDGLLEDLAAVPSLAKAIGQVDPASLSAASVDGKNYGLPLALTGGQHTTVLYSNKALLDEIGMAAPTSIDELKAMVGPLKARGAAPLVHPAGDTFMNPLLLMWLLPVIAGGDDPIKFVTDTQKGDIKYNSDGWVQTFETIADLATSGVLLPGSGAVTFEASPQLLLQGKAACIYNGTWMIPSFKSGKGFEPQITALPTVAGGSRPRPIVAYVAYGMPAGGQKKEAVSAFLEYAATPEVDAAVTKASQSFSPVAASNASVTSTLAKQAVPFFSDAIAPMDWLWEPEIATEIGTQVQSLIKGETAPRAVADKLQKTMDGLQSSGRAFYS